MTQVSQSHRHGACWWFGNYLAPIHLQETIFDQDDVGRSVHIMMSIAHSFVTLVPYWLHPPHHMRVVLWLGNILLCFNSSLPGQNVRHFVDDIFRWIFLNEKFCILIKISLKFVPDGPIDNNPALVQIMAWRGIGDKPLSEPMLTQFTDAYMPHQGEMC